MAGTSDARIAANRKNALKSSGPKTPEGKAKARANAVKHGLTGAGVALPTEDAALVEQRFLGLQEEMGPSTLASRLLVRQMALMSVRIERAAIQETAALASKIRHASTEFDLARLQEVDRLFESIEECPGDHRRRLLTQPEGIDKLIEALTSARDQLQAKWQDRWGVKDRKKIEAFFGGTFGNFPVTRTDALLVALDGEFQHLKLGEVAHLSGKKAKSEYARVELIRVIEVELSKLATIRAGFDLEALERDRLEAADRALFDPCLEATNARKYEAAATRGFFRALSDFRENEANRAADLAPISDRELCCNASSPNDFVRLVEPTGPVEDEPTSEPVIRQNEANLAPARGPDSACESVSGKHEPDSPTEDDGPAAQPSTCQNEPNEPRRGMGQPTIRPAPKGLSPTNHKHF